MVLNPRETGKLISEKAQHVKINEEGIKNLGEKIIGRVKDGFMKKSEFCNVAVHPKPTDTWAIDWIFIVDTLNFCFWTPKSNPSEANVRVAETRWRVDSETGYFGLCAAINRAMRDQINILNPEFLSKLTRNELEKIFESDDKKTSIPLLDHRVQVLNEIGTILQEKFNGTFKTCLQQANKSAVQLLKIITENFPCFQDEAIFNNEKISFYKRAQILVADIWSCYHNTNLDHNLQEISNLANFYDIDQITMFADYRVPQILNYFHVLEYSDELMQTLQAETILQSGHKFELEIRGCSIHAIELLNQWLHKEYPELSQTINPILLDQYLWELRREIAEEIQSIPFHRVISIYY